MPRERKMYGFFQCPDCHKKWESACTYCDRDTEEPLYQQECGKCGTSCFPYLVEPLVCSECKEQECVCTEEEKEERHSDLSKPHRSDLCERCQSGRPCA